MSVLTEYTVDKKDAILFPTFYPIKVSLITIPPKKMQYQSFLLLGLAAFFIAHFTLLNPTNLEEDFSETRAIAPEELLSFFQNETITLAKGVPNKEAPAYVIRDLEYFATDNQKQNWKMIARKSFAYQKEAMIHARDVIFIWKDGQVASKEAISSQTKNEVELYGDVVVTLNNGMVIHTEYVKIITTPFTQVIIPPTQAMWGNHRLNKKVLVNFKSFGLYYTAETETLKLLSQAETEIVSDKKSKVYADLVTYHRNQEILSYEMAEHRPLAQQFVNAYQDELHLRSRTMTVTFEKDKVQVLTANTDTSFEDKTNQKHPVSGTSGKAIYKETSNLLFLKDFPQVYQDRDTITGDVIIYDRTNDTIEVEQSNAFNRR